jgi:hypothetical protein
VLDVPFAFHLRGKLHDMAYYIFLGAYHGQPVAACYNSFEVPLQKDVEALAARLPDAAAADALWALGFRTVVVHEDRLVPAVAPTYVARLARATPGRTRLVPVAAAPGHARLRFESPVAVEASLAALAAGAAPAAVAEVTPPGSALELTFVNGAAAVYRHPDPIEPSAVLIRWRGESGTVVREDTIRLLLPAALAAGESAVRRTIVPVPAEPGLYEVTAAPAATPELVVARRTVRVRGATTGAGA